MLEIVDDDQHLAIADRSPEVAFRAEDTGDRRRNECGLAQRGEVDPEDARPERAHELRRGLERQAGLARAPGTGEGQETRATPQPRGDVLRLAAASEACVRGPGKVRVRDRPQWRERQGSDLEDTNRLLEVLQAVFAEVPDRRQVLVGQLAARRCREEDLPAVGGRGDARAEMDVRTDVALRRQVCGARMDAHPDPHPCRGKRGLPFPGGPDGARGGRERDEERIALGVHLHAGVAIEGLPQGPPVLREGFGVGDGPQLAQEARRTLDIGEQERHAAGGKLAHDGDDRTERSSALADRAGETCGRSGG